MARKKQQTPAQAQRNKVAAAIRARGERVSNIWLVRPPFQTRDLILNSDPQFEAFYLLEGEPTFAEIRYLPHWYEVESGTSASPPSSELAIVTTLDRQELPVHLAFGAEPPKAVAEVALTPVDGVIRINLRVLDNHAQRIENWRRIIPCIRRVRLHATTATERQIAVLLHAQGRSTLRGLRARFGDLDTGTFYGAVAILLRRRELLSDLDTRPWSLETMIWNATA